jgi:hypothetical protein
MNLLHPRTAQSSFHLIEAADFVDMSQKAEIFTPVETARACIDCGCGAECLYLGEKIEKGASWCVSFVGLN